MALANARKVRNGTGAAQAVCESEDHPSSMNDPDGSKAEKRRKNRRRAEAGLGVVAGDPRRLLPLPVAVQAKASERAHTRNRIAVR